MGKFFKQIGLPTGLILVLPLLGIFSTGKPVLPYLAFPPKPVIISHAPFSLPVFMAVLLFIVLTLFPFLKKGLAHTEQTPKARGPLPWWGYVSFAGLVFFWTLAWTRCDFFSLFQAHTFFPLWLCWIVCVNALVFRSQVPCPLLKAPGKFLGLFIVSAFFWWVFEFLNRFVGNWHYSGSQYSGCQYFLLATLSFSTVLPAIESMKAYILTFDRFKNGFRQFRPVPGLTSKGPALCMVGLSSGFLFLIGIFPDLLFPLVWICPFFIFLGFRIAFGRPHVFAGAANGDVTMVVAYAAAALVCGFFWEMFNMYSLARWQYTIPYVDVWHLFEMPIAGYAGYLPFGLECAVIIDLVMKPSHH